ncbi:MAG TPA: PQQ-binding-like beta-propeller repeat protein [Micromonosporaceae bacterium]|jgi:hypothetical protein
MSGTIAWSVPLDNAGTGLLLPRPGGGVLMFSSRRVAAFDARGAQLWATQPTGASIDLPVIGPQSTVARIEEDDIVVRDLSTGAVVASHRAALATGLSVAPWGDLLFSQASPGSLARLICISPTGEPQWATLLDSPAPLTYPPLPFGAHVVVERAGELRALDRDGETAWSIPLPGARLSSAPQRPWPGMVALGTQSDAGPSLHLLSGERPALSVLASPSPVLAPFAVLAVEGQWVIAGQGPAVQTGPGESEYPLVALRAGPGGVRPWWEHRLPARPRSVLAVPAGGLVLTLCPAARRWEDYHQYYDLGAETFVRLLDPAGATRWSWHPQRPFTHFPVVDEHGLVILGADDQLWAFLAG